MNYWYTKPLIAIAIDINTQESLYGWR